MLLLLVLACAASVAPDGGKDTAEVVTSTPTGTAAGTAGNGSATTPTGTTTPVAPEDWPVQLLSYDLEDAEPFLTEIRHVGEVEGWPSAVVFNAWPSRPQDNNEEHHLPTTKTVEDAVPVGRIDHVLAYGDYEDGVSSGVEARNLGPGLWWSVRVYDQDGLADCLVVAGNEEELAAFPDVLADDAYVVPVSAPEELVGCRTEIREDPLQ